MRDVPTYMPSRALISVLVSRSPGLPVSRSPRLPVSPSPSVLVLVLIVLIGTQSAMLWPHIRAVIFAVRSAAVPGAVRAAQQEPQEDRGRQGILDVGLILLID